jgi:hypothetical protein
MSARRERGSIVLAILLSFMFLAFAACRSSGGGGASPTPSGPSGALGVVTIDAASTAVQGLCTMRSTDANDLRDANGVFYDKTHDELHVIAAATEVKDRTLAAHLLQAKEKVEADLTDEKVPEGFVDDIDALLSATQDALQAIGLTVPGCA